MLLRLSILYLAILYLGVLGLPLGVQAQDRQNYVTLNYAEFERKIPGGKSVEGDGIGIGYGLIINELVDIESVFTDYDYDTFEITLGTGAEAKNASVRGMKARTLELSAYFKSPISNRFMPFVIVGMIAVDRQIPDNVKSVLDDSSFEPYIGAGLDIRLSENWDIRAAFKPFRGDINADVYSIGPKYKF